MSLSIVRSKIDHCNAILEEDLGDLIEARPAKEMAKNQARVQLADLYAMEANLVKEFSKLYLAKAPASLLPELQANGVIAADHLSVARRLADRFWAQLKPGVAVTAFIVAQMNEYLDDVCGENLIDNYTRPRLYLTQSNMVILSDKEHFVTVIERILEENLKSNDNEIKGHQVQAVVNTNALLKQYRALPVVDDIVSFVVLVPEYDNDMVNAYKRFLSNNIFTVDIDSSSSVSVLDQVLASTGNVQKKVSKNKKYVK